MWQISYPLASLDSHFCVKIVGIHNDSASKSWSKYTTDDKAGKVNYVKVTYLSHYLDRYYYPLTAFGCMSKHTFLLNFYFFLCHAKNV